MEVEAEVEAAAEVEEVEGEGGEGILGSPEWLTFALLKEHVSTSSLLLRESIDYPSCASGRDRRVKVQGRVVEGCGGEGGKNLRILGRYFLITNEAAHGDKSIPPSSHRTITHVLPHCCFCRSSGR